MPAISIIVPVYRVEKYLEKCVDSILCQTFTDMEVLLVDDGSPDRCGEICDAYAQKDSRVHVIHQKNGGLSAARNAGLDAAQGDYIGFVDSDDFVDEDMYAFLYEGITRQQADIAMCGIYYCYADRTLTPPAHLCETLSPVQAIEQVLLGRNISVNAVNKLYKRHIFETLRYPVGKTTEDGFVIVEVLLAATSIYVDNLPKYHYFLRENSISTREYTPLDRDVVLSYEKNAALIRARLPQLSEVADYKLQWAYMYILNHVAGSKKTPLTAYREDIRFVAAFIRRQLFRILRNPYHPRRQKLLYVLAAVSPYLYIRIQRKRLTNKMQVH